MKRCTSCRQEKPFTDFFLDKRRNKPRGRCKKCHGLWLKEWRSRLTPAQKDALRAKEREQWAIRYAEDPERFRSWRRQWARANPSKVQAGRVRYREENRDEIAARGRAWRKANPQKMLSYQARRRAKKRMVEHEHVDRLAVYERDGGRCHICNRFASKKTFVLDHLIPLSKNGPHTYANLRVAHRRCNAKRGAGRLPAQLLLIPECGEMKLEAA